jgi:hypothetical protein
MAFACASRGVRPFESRSDVDICRRRACIRVAECGRCTGSRHTGACSGAVILARAPLVSYGLHDGKSWVHLKVEILARAPLVSYGLLLSVAGTVGEAGVCIG